MSGIYPKKKVRQAFSGMNTEQIEGVDNAIISGAGSIPVYGQAISAGLSIGKNLGTAIEGSGTNGAKNALADIVNPLSAVNAIMSGKPLESIPIVGGLLRAKRNSKEQERMERLKEAKDTQEASLKSNQKFTKLTYAEGGTIPGQTDYAKGEAVVLGGKTHEEGGNALIDEETGEKVAETEREELLFSADQTQKIENHISMYDKTSDQKYLIELGRCVQKIILTDTVDHSKQFSK